MDVIFGYDDDEGLMEGDYNETDLTSYRPLLCILGCSGIVFIAFIALIVYLVI